MRWLYVFRVLLKVHVLFLREQVQRLAFVIRKLFLLIVYLAHALRFKSLMELQPRLDHARVVSEFFVLFFYGVQID